MIQIDKLERQIEFRLGPHLRRVLRTILVLLTNTVLALMVLGATRVFEIVIDYLHGRDPEVFGIALLRYLTKGIYLLDALIIAIFLISATVQMFRIALGRDD